MKPHPGGLQKTMQKFAVAPENTWMVGDADVDILTGKNAGTMTAGVLWGATESLHHLSITEPDAIFPDYQEIAPFFERLSRV
jgi:phosphoglycolate phosphatase-like HAD superfamily hydrolase